MSLQLSMNRETDFHISVITTSYYYPPTLLLLPLYGYQLQLLLLLLRLLFLLPTTTFTYCDLVTRLWLASSIGAAASRGLGLGLSADGGARRARGVDVSPVPFVSCRLRKAWILDPSSRSSSAMDPPSARPCITRLSLAPCYTQPESAWTRAFLSR